MGPLIAVLLLCVIIYGYVKAFRKVKKGDITVYKDWHDFIWSVAWLFCLIVGLFFLILGSVSRDWYLVFYLISIVCGVIVCISFVHLVVGAFLLNKDRHDAWLSLFARFVGAAFTVGIVGLIWQEDGRDARHKPNLLMEVLWILVYCWIFKTCLLPLIQDNRNGVVASNYPSKGKKDDPIHSDEFVKMCRSFQEGEDGLIEFIEMAGEMSDKDFDQDDVDAVEKCFDEVARPGVERMKCVLAEYTNMAFVGSEKKVYELLTSYVKKAEAYLESFDKLMSAGDDSDAEERMLDQAAEELDKVVDELEEMGWRE